jgi:hypothetical protein
MWGPESCVRPVDKAMRKLLLLALVAATVGTASATAQSYSGTWSLDPKRSVLEDGVDPVSLTLVVLDTAVTIRVTVRRASRSRRAATAVPRTSTDIDLAADG